MKGKRLLTLLITSFLVMVLTTIAVGGCSSPASTGAPTSKITGPGWPKELTAAQAGGTTQFFSIALANLIPRYIDVNILVEPVSGTSEAVARIAKGDFDITLADGTKSYQGLIAGTGFEDAPKDNYRTMLLSYDQINYLVARADSGIKSLANLKGKRFMYGGPAYRALEQAWNGALKGAGLDPKDVIQLPFPGKDPAATALIEGKTDASVWTGGVPDVTLIELMKNLPVVILPLTAKEQAGAAVANYFPGVIPGGSYPGYDKDLPELTSGKTHLLVRKSLPDDMVYQMEKVIFAHLDAIQSAHIAFRSINTTNALDVRFLLAPLHPGAIKYATEAGLWKIEDVQANDALLAKLQKDLSAPKPSPKPTTK